MSNPLEFILKLTDQFSPALNAARGVSDNVCNRIAADMNKVNQNSRQMASSVNELRSRLEDVNKVRFGTRIVSEFNAATRQAKELERQIERLEGRGQKSGGSGRGMLGSIVGGNLISNAIGAIGSGLMAGGRAIIGGASQQDKDMTGLKTFLGEAGAKAAYANIKLDAAATPFDTAGLLTVNRALISAGLNAKDARRDTMNLANAVSAVGGGNEELNRMAVNMQQIKTVGKATAMDIKQFGFAGINIYKILADATGKSIDQVKDMDVSYNLLSKSLQRAAEKGGAYFGAMEAQSKTIPGLWSTFMDNINQKAGDIGTALKPVILWFLDIGIKITNNFAGIMTYVQPVVDILNKIPGMFDNINSPTSQWHRYIVMVTEVLGAAWDMVKSVAGNVWHVVSGMIEFTSKSEILKDIFFVISSVAKGVFWFISQIGDALTWVWDNILKPYYEGIDKVYSKIKDLMHLGHKTEYTISNNGYYDNLKIAPAAPKTTTDVNGGRSSTVTAKDLAVDDEKAKRRARGINEGGQRTITINIGKQIEKLEVHVANATEGVREIEAQVREVMMRVFTAMNDQVVSN